MKTTLAYFLCNRLAKIKLWTGSWETSKILGETNLVKIFIVDNSVISIKIKNASTNSIYRNLPDAIIFNCTKHTIKLSDIKHQFIIIIVILCQESFRAQTAQLTSQLYWLKWLQAPGAGTQGPYLSLWLSTVFLVSPCCSYHGCNV